MKGKWPILFLIWLMMLVAYFDRVNISVAGPTISTALGLSKTQLGWVLAGFSLGYALFQVPGGFLADRFGARPVLVFAIVFWSIFTAATGLVTSLGAMLAVRVLFGMGEGLENGAQFRLIGHYFEPAERSKASALFLTALALGPAIGTPCAAWLIQHQGWRQMFQWFALLGILVAVLLFALLPRSEQVSAGAVVPAGDGGIEPTSKAAKALCFATYLFFNGAFWGFIGWVPSYLKDARHLTLSKLGLLGATPYLCGFVAMVVMGHLGSTVFLTRRSSLLVGCYLGGAVSLYFALNASTVAGSIVGLCAAGACLYSSFGPFWAIAIDSTGAKNRGALTGFVNFGGQIGGFFAQIAIGRLVDVTGSYALGLTYMMATLVLAAIAAALMGWGWFRPVRALGLEGVGSATQMAELRT